VLSDKKLTKLLEDRPIFITENGYSHLENKPGTYAQALTNAESDFSKDIKDNYRIKFIRDHLIAVHKAISEGANIQGYFYWSLLDNFEWALGMDPRFGLIHVDQQSFARTPKSSYHYYADIAKNNGLIINQQKSL
jgi:beta-glucosidase